MPSNDKPDDLNISFALNDVIDTFLSDFTNFFALLMSNIKLDMTMMPDNHFSPA